MAKLSLVGSFVVFIVCLMTSEVRGHGRLIEPPGRSSMWRFGFKTPVNYNDNELFCGGFSRQYDQNEGKCGICGDPWDQQEPRNNEDGGKYGRGVIARTYKAGDTIDIHVEVTAYHKGYFEFKVCPLVDIDGIPLTQKADQQCLDKYPLELREADESMPTRYYFPPGSGVGTYKFRATLPQDLSCQQCVLQWHYYTGNNWGWCSDGTGKLGCGNQEVFRGCADIKINA